MIVVFSGTTEGRQLSHQLAAEGAAVTVCVATEYGAAEQGTAPGLAVHTGRMEAGEMAALLRGTALCVDATHPYARQASENIRAACALAGVGYLRLLRPASPLPGDALTAPDAPAAARLLEAGRSPDTPCGWVRNIGRAGQTTCLLTLAQLQEAEVDMFTTVFVGASSTRMERGRLITPRGYKK